MYPAHTTLLLCAIWTLSQSFGFGAQPVGHEDGLNVDGRAILDKSEGPSMATVLTNFGSVTLSPALVLDGAGENIDSIAFWEAPDPTNTLMFVTGKDNDLVEVWQYPFVANELAPILFPANINGVGVDQETDLLYVSDRVVSVFSLPGRQSVGSLGQGILGIGENNLDILKSAAGQTEIYVSDDHNVYRFEAISGQLLGSFAPPVSSIETVLADDYYQMILVPEEQGPAGYPGIYAYHPDGTVFERNGTNRFGNNGEFDADEEGILLYTFPAHGADDDGRGFIVVSDQRSDVTDFECFDRQTWAHLGTFQLQGVSNTDGIASTQRALPGYPLGVFAAINNDTSVVIVGWNEVFAAMGWDLAPEAVRITPDTPSPTDASSVAFTVLFSEAVNGFDELADLVVMGSGLSITGASITGSGATYSVNLTGLSGVGSLTLAVSTSSDVLDLASNTFASSVSSDAVQIGTAYYAWASASGLDPEVNGIADDPDGDGCFNIKEFAMGSDPLSDTDAGKQRVALDPIGGSKYFTYTFPARHDANFARDEALLATVDRVVYTLDGSFDLNDCDEDVEELIPALNIGLPALDAGWSYHSFRLSRPVSELSEGYIRLGISPER